MPPLLPMPGEGGAAGRGGAIGAAGFAATGAGAIGFGAITGFAAGALRAAGFRAVLVLFFAVVLRALARFAPVFRAGAFFALVFLAVILRAPVFFAPARPALALFFLLVVRFFPLVLVAMASAPICSIAALDRLNGRVSCTNYASLAQACRPTRRVDYFLHYTMIAMKSGNLGDGGARNSTTKLCLTHADAQTVTRLPLIPFGAPTR